MNSLSPELSALWSLVSDPRWASLIALLLTAAWIDWHKGRIPNGLTMGGAVLGLAFSALAGRPGWDGLLDGSLGLAVGLLLFLPPYLVRAVGAGDAKLMAMAGAFLGPLPTIFSAFLVALVGGVAALVFAARRRNLQQLALNSLALVQSVGIGAGWQPPRSVGRLRFGSCICAGTVAFLVLHALRPF